MRTLRVALAVLFSAGCLVAAARAADVDTGDTVKFNLFNRSDNPAALYRHLQPGQLNFVRCVLRHQSQAWDVTYGRQILEFEVALFPRGTKDCKARETRYVRVYPRRNASEKVERVYMYEVTGQDGSYNVLLDHKGS